MTIDNHGQHRGLAIKIYGKPLEGDKVYLVEFAPKGEFWTVGIPEIPKIPTINSKIRFVCVWAKHVGEAVMEARKIKRNYQSNPQKNEKINTKLGLDV